MHDLYLDLELNSPDDAYKDTSRKEEVEAEEEDTTEEAAFWINEATADARLSYFNTLTGVSKMELPLQIKASCLLS